MTKQDVMDILVNNSLGLFSGYGKTKIDFVFGGGEIYTKTRPEEYDYHENYITLSNAVFWFGGTVINYKTILLAYDKIVGIAFG
jgi:hypothetical protein